MALLLTKTNKVLADSTRHYFNPIALMIIIAFAQPNSVLATGNIEFNTDILDLKDCENIDLSEFTQAGYIMPGTYPFYISLNNNTLPSTYDVPYIVSEQNEQETVPCLSPEIISQLALRNEWQKKAQWWHDGQCLKIDSITGMSAQGSLATETINITIPQAYLEYTAENWDPPSRWDNGISGALFDYNINAQVTDHKNSNTNQQITGNGVMGFNLGAWRFRANWQANYNDTTGQSTERSWDWSQYYAYRAISELSAKLTLGEEYLRSGIFDSFRFLGASLVSEDNMLAPNLRGYAPEVSGVAKTNAKVTISQMGRVIYETQVAPGPFRIQDLSDAVNGKLNVRVEEQDGSVQEFQMDTATIPYLTRPGRVQFKLIGGRPSNMDHRTEGPGFALGEFSWGVSNGWSLYGGLLGAGDYNALSVGVGRDLMMFGAISFDITESRAKLPSDNKTYTGGSYRLSYSKRFEQYDSQVTFAGYRFSERDFMNMNQYLDRRYRNSAQDNTKELYTIMLNKQFVALGLSAYFDYSHETYWNRPNTKRYNLSLSKYFDLGKFKNINVSLNAFRNQYEGRKNDDGLYLNVSLPMGDAATISYNSVINRTGNSHTVSYYDRLDDRNSYRLGTGLSARGKATANGYYIHYGDAATVTGNASYVAGDYSSAALSLQGGATLTGYGAALHRINLPGASRVMVDTENVANVPIKGFGANTRTNRFGKAVIADINDYYRMSTSVDLNKLPDNVEAVKSVQQFTVTEGAIAYRKFDVLSGLKTMVRLALADGSYPPFGASILNAKKHEVGIVNDNGSVYLSGINPNEILDVNWNGQTQCRIQIPQNIESVEFNSLLLPCDMDPSATPVNTATAPVIHNVQPPVTPVQNIIPRERWLLTRPDIQYSADDASL
ncbi:outer membrane usher protein [Providencia manganoxydans]|uniref:outer membrane usher protein n=1 Tax=Providencia manganoxydans TaxID=2923283 RepID=UPI003AF3D5B0